MRTFFQQALAFPSRLADEADFSVFQVPKTTVDDASRTARGATGEIRLLYQQHAAACVRTLAGNGNAIDATADDGKIKMLPVQRSAIWVQAHSET
jgi:hypothetical protein